MARKIDEIRRTMLVNKGINVTKIDIIAHSGGGLVSRYYIAMRKNAAEGGAITWIFCGSNQIEEKINVNINWGGEGYAYASMNLEKYGEKAVGNWTLTIYLNNAKTLEQSFSVQRTSHIPCS